MRTNIAKRPAPPTNAGSKIRRTPWPERRLIGAEEKQAVASLFDRSIASGRAFGYNGPEEQAFCAQFAAFMGGGYADAVSSGTAAVYVALRALNPEPYSEIIVGAITDPGGMMPIALLNCIPMVADTAPGSFNTGPEQVAELISPRTSAILVAHIQGEPVDMPGILRVARRRGIPVVEDCAQAHGALLNNRLVGTFGHVSAFSTMFGKHFCTGGQGGMVFTRDEKIYASARRVSDRGKPFGLPPGSTNSVAALNLNLNDLAAVIGSVQLKKLPGIVRRRRWMAQYLRTALGDLRLISFPRMITGAEPSYWHLRIRFNAGAASCDKKAFCAALEAEGLEVICDYPAMPHTYDWFKNRCVFGTSGLPWSSPLYRGDPDRQFPCPNARAAIRDHFILSTYETWGSAEARDLVKIFKALERRYAK